MKKYDGVFINTIESDRKLIAKIDAELARLPKWRVIRRQWLLGRRAKLAEKILEQQAIKAGMKDGNYTDMDVFFGTRKGNHREHR